MYHYISLLFVLLWTITRYGAGPVLLATKWKKPIRRWQLAAFCTIYTLFAWIAQSLFLFIYSNGQDMANEKAALIWGFLFYRYAQRALRERGLYEPPR